MHRKQKKTVNKLVLLMMSKRKRYWRLKEIAEILFKGNLTYTALYVCAARKSGWKIITGKKGYTLRPTSGDYLHHAKYMTMHAKGTIKNVIAVSEAGGQVVSDNMKRIIQEEVGNMKLLLEHKEEK